MLSAAIYRPPHMNPQEGAAAVESRGPSVWADYWLRSWSFAKPTERHVIPNGQPPSNKPGKTAATTFTVIRQMGASAHSCYHAVMQPELKRVGQSGQISVGREMAGKLLRLEQLEDGRLLLTPVVDVPESQLWTLSEPHKSRIERGLAWASKTPAKETDLTALVAKATRRKNR